MTDFAVSISNRIPVFLARGEMVGLFTGGGHRCIYNRLNYSILKKPLVYKLKRVTGNYECQQAGELSQCGIFLYFLEKQPSLGRWEKAAASLKLQAASNTPLRGNQVWARFRFAA